MAWGQFEERYFGYFSFGFKERILSAIIPYWNSFPDSPRGMTC
jgi:hypothetical protein